MARVCNRHPFILSENLCGRCGREFCRECLVSPRGQKLPLCVDCAVARSGVRTGKDAGLSKRDIRALVRARRAELAEQATPPLPEIENQVPAGWARNDDDEPLDLAKVATPGRRRYRDASPKPAPERAAGPQVTPPEPAAEGSAGRRGRAARRAQPDTTREETADMMSFLDSMYSKD